MRFTSEQHLDDGVLERGFSLGGIPGLLWTAGSVADPAPLILLGHPGGLSTVYPRLVARARQAVAEGFSAATIELPWSGDRPGRLLGRGDLHRGPAGPGRAAHRRRAAVRRQLRARAIVAHARRVTVPLLVLLQWDDEHNDRQMALDLFDAFGTTQKTLHANMGGHTGVPHFEGDAANRFFARHLK